MLLHALPLRKRSSLSYEPFPLLMHNVPSDNLLLMVGYWSVNHLNILGMPCTAVGGWIREEVAARGGGGREVKVVAGRGRRRRRRRRGRRRLSMVNLWQRYLWRSFAHADVSARNLGRLTVRSQYSTTVQYHSTGILYVYSRSCIYLSILPPSPSYLLVYEVPERCIDRCIDRSTRVATSDSSHHHISITILLNWQD